MLACAICLDPYESPTAFPCGHVFCLRCIERTVQRRDHLACAHCPTCRASFPLATINPALLPPHIRPFFQPPLRKLYLDTHAAISNAPCKESTPNAPITLETPVLKPSARICEGAVEIARLRAELDAVRSQSAGWQRRAELMARVVGSAVRESVRAEVIRLKNLDESTRCHELRQKMQVLESAMPVDKSGQGLEEHPFSHAASLGVEENGKTISLKKRSREPDVDENDSKCKRARHSTKLVEAGASESREHTPSEPSPTEAELSAAHSLRLLSAASPEPKSMPC